MIAVCDADALDATARGSNRSGTSAGSSACIVGISNARAQPMTNTSAKITCSVIQPIALPAASVGHGHERDELAHAEDAPAIEAIGDVPDDQHERKRRQELHEADETEVERAAGQRVDLPADGDRQHLIRHDRRDPREPQAGERSVGEDGFVDRGGSAVHARLRTESPRTIAKAREHTLLAVGQKQTGTTAQVLPACLQRPWGPPCRTFHWRALERRHDVVRDRLHAGMAFSISENGGTQNAWFSSKAQDAGRVRSRPL